MEIAVGRENEDGRIVAGAFDPSPELFPIGAGGPADPDAFVFRVRVTNEHCFALREVVVTGTLPGTAVTYRGLVAGFPNRGVVEEQTAVGLVWRIGELPAHSVAELRIRAEGIAEGETVHRVELTAAEIPGAVVHEEPVRVGS